jgi:hypothetical protein
MSLPNIDVASQLLGSTKGHELNVKVDETISNTLLPQLEKLGVDFAQSEAAKFLTGLGFPATLQGAVSYVDSRINAAIDGDTGISATAKSDLEAVVTGLVNIIKGSVPAVNV